jgi:putative holliday junction resolvase
LTRLLGIDLGTRRIGLAVAELAADGATRIRPLATLSRASIDRDRAAIERVVLEQRVDEIVVGLPLNMDGSEGTMAAAARAWAAAVLEPLALAVSWRDERLTSERAETRLRAPRRGRAGGPPSSAQRSAHRQALDREAAAAILQAEIDARVAAS